MLLIINGTRARLSERRGLGSAGSGDAAITRLGWQLRRLPQHFRAEALGGVEGNGGAGGCWLTAAALPGPRHLPISGEPLARQGRGCCRGTAGSLRRRGSPSLGEVHGVLAGDTGWGGPLGRWWPGGVSTPHCGARPMGMGPKSQTHGWGSRDTHVCLCPGVCGLGMIQLPRNQLNELFASVGERCHQSVPKVSRVGALPLASAGAHSWGRGWGRGRCRG